MTPRYRRKGLALLLFLSSFSINVYALPTAATDALTSGTTTTDASSPTASDQTDLNERPAAGASTTGTETGSTSTGADTRTSSPTVTPFVCDNHCKIGNTDFIVQWPELLDVPPPETTNSASSSASDELSTTQPAYDLDAISSSIQQNFTTKFDFVISVVTGLPTTVINITNDGKTQPVTLTCCGRYDIAELDLYYRDPTGIPTKTDGGVDDVPPRDTSGPQGLADPLQNGPDTCHSYRPTKTQFIATLSAEEFYNVTATANLLFPGNGCAVGETRPFLTPPGTKTYVLTLSTPPTQTRGHDTLAGGGSSNNGGTDKGNSGGGNSGGTPALPINGGGGGNNGGGGNSGGGFSPVTGKPPTTGAGGGNGGSGGGAGGGGFNNGGIDSGNNNGGGDAGSNPATGVNPLTPFAGSGSGSGSGSGPSSVGGGGGGGGDNGGFQSGSGGGSFQSGGSGVGQNGGFPGDNSDTFAPPGTSGTGGSTSNGGNTLNGDNGHGGTGGNGSSFESGGSASGGEFGAGGGAFQNGSGGGSGGSDTGSGQGSPSGDNSNIVPSAAGPNPYMPTDMSSAIMYPFQSGSERLRATTITYIFVSFVAAILLLL